MNDNLKLYEKYRKPPSTACRTIKGGRLNGFTDIQPMWRIQALTEHFGQCGIGWYVDVIKQWTETSPKNELACFVEVNLFVKNGEEWSKGIYGVGGSKILQTEKGDLYLNDEGYKKAFTDALGSCCKMLGFAADIYWQQADSKYTKNIGYANIG